MNHAELSQQAAAIPFRRVPDGIAFCLITKSASQGWGVPKGMIDPGCTPEQTALQEAKEEAGLGGRLVGARVGTYEYEKWGVLLTVSVFLMEVSSEAAEWDEMAYRSRRWVRYDEATTLLEEHPVSSLFEAAAQILGLHRRGPRQLSPKV